MKSEYDFKNAQRGKFFRKDASLELSVYLEAGVRAYLTERAKAKGVPVVTSTTISSSVISNSSRRQTNSRG